MFDSTTSTFRRTLAGLVCAASIAGGASLAHAIASPGAINWSTGSATAFVTSLYVGVLGRAPESVAVVAGWAAGVTGINNSRLRVFHGFINSPEYRGRYGSVQGRYTVWTNNCPKSPNNRFRVSTRMPRGSWSSQNNQVARNYGLALIGYYRAIFPYRRC